MFDFLSKIECLPDAGLVRVGSFGLAFMPESALYRGQGGYTYPVELVVRKRDKGQEVGRYKLTVQPRHTVFSVAGTSGQPMDCRLVEAGDYSLAVELEKVVLAKVDFTAKLEASGDAFNPVQRLTIDGPWPRLACLVLPKLGDPDQNPRLRTWERGGLFNRKKSETLGIEVYEGKDLVFVSTPGYRNDGLTESMWRHMDLVFQFRTGDGGGPTKVKDLCKKDGEFLVVRKREGELTGAWKLVIRDGKPVAHPRSQLSYDPPTERLIGRTPAAIARDNSDLCWLEEVEFEAAKATLGGGDAAAASASVEDIARWTSAQREHTGPAKLVTTNVDCRMDGTLALSDSVVAFATGGGNGVGFLRIGEDSAQSIPDGQSYNGKLFCVCGPKIVLVKGSGVAVFDTKTMTTHEVPAQQISLQKTSGDMYGANFIAGDGMLVATLNDPKKVDDRAMFKVIDLSGDEPKVIVLDNIDVAVRDLTSVSVDAETGRFGVVSQRVKKFWVAPVVAGAGFTEYDVSGHDGIHRNAQLRIEGTRALYFDEVGKPKLRALDLDTKQCSVIGTIGKPMNWFTATPTHVAFVTDQSYGSNYHVKKGVFGGPFESFENSGKDAMAGGNFGLGTSLALASDGTLVLAGQGSGGVATGEFLQVEIDKIWAVVAGEDGKPVPAVDVRQGPGVLAFKTGSRNDTKVAYLLTGSKPQWSSLKLLR